MCQATTESSHGVHTSCVCHWAGHRGRGQHNSVAPRGKQWEFTRSSHFVRSHFCQTLGKPADPSTHPCEETNVACYRGGVFGCVLCVFLADCVRSLADLCPIRVHACAKQQLRVHTEFTLRAFAIGPVTGGAANTIARRHGDNNGSSHGVHTSCVHIFARRLANLLIHQPIHVRKPMRRVIEGVFLAVFLRFVG